MDGRIRVQKTPHNCHYLLDEKLHREDGPAVEWVNGDKSYWINDKLHREDGPAIECSNGDKAYYIHGKRHREDGPAVESADGSKEYWVNDKRHREDGPAVEFANGYKEYWVNGYQLKVCHEVLPKKEPTVITPDNSFSVRIAKIQKQLLELTQEVNELQKLV